MKNNSPRWWKSLRMLVYVAQGLVAMHVALEALRSETNPVYVGVLQTGVCVVAGLHIAAAMMRRPRDAAARRGRRSGWRCAGWERNQKRAKGIRAQGNPVAVFKHEGKFSAMAGACVHQGGPLAEGKFVGGCLTCPWHGYQHWPGMGARRRRLPRSCTRTRCGCGEGGSR